MDLSQAGLKTHGGLEGLTHYDFTSPHVAHLNHVTQEGPQKYFENPLLVTFNNLPRSWNIFNVSTSKQQKYIIGMISNVFHTQRIAFSGHAHKKGHRTRGESKTSLALIFRGFSNEFVILKMSL